MGSDLDGTHHKLPRLWPPTPALDWLTHVVQICHAEVAGHHNDRVAEVDNVTLAVCEVTSSRT